MDAPIQKKIFAAVLLCAFFVQGLHGAQAQNADIDALRAKIQDRNSEIEKIEKQIAVYQGEIAKVGSEKASLQGAIRELEINADRLRSEINLTESKISRAELTIEDLGYEIDDKEARITLSKEAVGEVLRELQQEDSESLVEMILREEQLSDVWSKIDTLSNLQRSIRSNLRDLEGLKIDLEENKENQISRKNELLELTEELVDRKVVVDINKNEKDKLLDETENKEANYQALLATQLKLREEFEAELRELESALEIAIDPNKLPSARSGVLAIPVDSPRITQHFGNTPFATQNPQIYNGSGHNGMDFGIPIGSSIYSAEGGVIKGTGNTDLTCPGASYGKWILVEHDNGLSSLYAHLSVISVGQGQRVERGSTIGYSGNTGFSTGPHLHFTVYATEGVQIKSFPSRGCPGATYTMPVADLDAYLNPLSYLNI